MKAKTTRLGRWAVMILMAALLSMSGCGGDRINGKPEPEGADGSARSVDLTISSDTNRWTAGIIDTPGVMKESAVLTNVRIGAHEDWDRIVFEFEGESLPGYHLEYIDRPIRRCGSGEVAPIEGSGWLQVHLRPARAHTSSGEATVTERETTPRLPVLEEAELVCDFEGIVEWVLGLNAPNRYRVLELGSPARLVVDILH